MASSPSNPPPAAPPTLRCNRRGVCASLLLLAVVSGGRAQAPDGQDVRLRSPDRASRAFAPAHLVTRPLAPELSAAIWPGSADVVVRGAQAEGLVILVLGTEPASLPLPGGGQLAVVPQAHRIAIADTAGSCRLELDFPIGAATGAQLLAQAIVIASAVPLGAPGSVATSALATLRIPERDAPADVVILFGQSNMEGQAAAAELEPELRGPLPGVRIWNAQASAFQALTVGINNTTIGNPAWTGPEMALGHELARRRSTGSPIWLVKFAVGNTSLGPTPGPWNEWGRSANELYGELLRRVDTACAAVRALGLRPRVRAIGMMQGENDCLRLDLASAYGTRLVELIGGLRGDLQRRELTDVAAAPFALGMVHARLAELGAPGVGLIRAAQAAAPGMLPNCFAIETSGMALQTDGVHLATAGVSALGRAFASVLLETGAL